MVLNVTTYLFISSNKYVSTNFSEIFPTSANFIGPFINIHFHEKLKSLSIWRKIPLHKRLWFLAPFNLLMNNLFKEHKQPQTSFIHNFSYCCKTFDDRLVFHQDVAYKIKEMIVKLCNEKSTFEISFRISRYVHWTKRNNDSNFKLNDFILHCLASIGTNFCLKCCWFQAYYVLTRTSLIHF